MSTETSLTILVVFLSVTLFIFLVLGIVLITKLIKISNTVDRITLKAEEIADKAEAAAEMIESAAGSWSVAKVVSNIVGLVSKNKNKRG